MFDRTEMSEAFSALIIGFRRVDLFPPEGFVTFKFAEVLHAEPRRVALTNANLGGRVPLSISVNHRRGGPQK